MKKAQSQNLAVKATITTPPPVPVDDVSALKDQCNRVISIPLTFEEFEALSIAAGRHNGGDVAAYLKESANASCESDTNALAHDLRSGRAKIVTLEGKARLEVIEKGKV